MTEDQIYSQLSDETLQKVADGGDLYESMTDDELQKVASFKDEPQPQSDVPQDNGYGFSERQADTVRARGGRDPYAGQAYVEGLTPFTRSAEEGNERYEDQHLGAFLSTDRDNPYALALRKYGEEQDPALKGYKAQTDAETAGHVNRLLAQAPLGVGWLFRKAREADNPVRYATDYLIQQAWKAGFSDEELEQAKEVSQGDPAKMYDFFAPRAAEKLKRYAVNRQEAAGKLQEHAGDESLGSKVAGGALGMIPMLEEFALGGAAGKAVTGAASLGKLNAIAKAAGTATWRGRLVNGLIHGLGTTATMGTEMTRRRYDELTADEYGVDERGELVKKEGDDSATAFKKAAIGGYGEAAIFSMPIGEAVLGRFTPAITKALRTKVGAPVARMYENYVKYGRMTGLRGQPQMLALMDLNAFKDEVLGMGVKDADYEGFSAAWDRFANETLSAKGQLDMFVSTLGVIAVQGGVALAKARSAIARERRSTDSVLQTYFGVPKENLAKMSPEHKAMWRELIMRRSLGTADKNARGWAMDAAKLRKFCERLDAKFGEKAGSTMEKMGEYALKFDNSQGWENKGDLDGIQSRFTVPATVRTEKGKDGKDLTRRVVPWEDAPVTLPDGTETQGQAFTDPNTGISVMRYMQTDRGAGDNGYVYLIRDGEGRRATRFGFADALEAAKDISRRQQKDLADRGVKLDALKRTYAELMPGESPLVVDTAEQAGMIKGSPLEAGEVAFTGRDGRQYYALDRFQTPEQMRKVILHEAGRHRGIDLALPTAADKMGFLVGLAKSNDPVIQDQLNRIVEARIARGDKIFGKPIERMEDLFKTDKDGNYDPNAANALEEVWAHLFDHEGVPAEAGWWDAHMNAIRGNLRKVFHGLSYSRSEAEEMYRGAMEKLKEQTGGAIDYAPAPSERELERSGMILDAMARAGNKQVGREAARDIAEIRDGGERRRAENEALGDRVQGEADARRNAEGAEEIRGAFAAEGLRMGMGRERAEAERRTEDERVAKEREITRKRQEELDNQKREAADYDEQERQRIERERREEQDAQDDAELERMLAEDERKKDMAEREDYQNRRREITEQRARDKAIAKEEAEAEAVRAAQEREKQAQEREAQRRAGYEAADAQARLDRKNAVKQAIREDDARRGEEYDRAEEERKRREAAEEAAGLPKITVEESAPQGKERTAPQNDVVRVNYGAEEGREGHQIVARRVTDGNGKVVGWDVNAVGKDGTETLIASTTKPKKDGEAAIRAVRRQIHEHFGLPYGKAQKEAMDAERRRLEEAEARRTNDETRNGSDEEPAKPEPEKRNKLPPEGEGSLPADEDSADAEGWNVVIHHANEGRDGDLMRAGDDALAGLFGDEPAETPVETPVEAPVAAPREEGAITPPNSGERAGGGESASGGESRSVSDIMSRWGLTDPSARFFNVDEELGADRRDKNWELVRDIAALYDQKKIRGFYDFAKMFKEANPAWYAEQKDGLRRLWNYAAETTGLFSRVGDYAARDAIRSVDEGRNVRDISGINALDAALQDIDVEMYPAAKLDRSDARVPNTKLAADPKSGIVPGHELKGSPRSLLSKPILGVEFEDGTVSVGTGRHRAELYARYGMDIPMRRVREADGWVTKKPDGTYDFTKIRLLDALDNIQDSKGTIEDYVAFFRDVKIPRSEAESEGFLGSKEARTAYALANDAVDDVRAAANFEGGRRAGYVSPEQAGAIADAAPKGAWEHNATVQRQLLKDVLADRSMDATDIAVDAGLIAEDIRREINAGKVFQGDLFGNIIDAGAELREKKRDYIRNQISRYERLAKDIRSAKNSENGLTIKRADMRALGINEREIAKGGADMRREYEKAAQRAALRAMEWRTGITSQLNPEDKAQMERDLGIAPKDRDTSASGSLPPTVAEAPAPATAETGSRVPAASARETPPPVDRTGAVGEQSPGFRGGRSGIVQKTAGDFKRGDQVFLKGASDGQRVTFLKANADGTADVQVRTPGANRYAPARVETRTIPMDDVSATGMRDTLTSAEQRTLANGMKEQGDIRAFDAAEEVTPERSRDYADWLNKYRMADSPDRRREWARKNPDKATPEALEKAAFEARQYTPAKYKIPGAVKSSTLLEEPPALRATEPPDNDYKLHIPDSIIKNGELQEHQAEFVGYAGRAHGMKGGNGSPLGMMGGYGTGAGKSRMIAGTILDNRNQGRKRALWITTQSGLVDDVRSESRPFGMDGMVSEMFSDKGVTVPKDGIGFGTYHGLRQEGVVEQIAQQLGKDFDGVIAFDEIHRAKTEGGDTQNAVVKLQELLPKARVIYMSATGATDVGNLGYATRLGLWGDGTAFKDFEDFKKKVEGKGVSAMEMVAQTLKRRGQYLSANLSKEGVEFDHVAVTTTDAQKRTYAEYNDALKDVYKGVYDALEAMGRLDYKVPPSSLHGMQQRLHYSMVTALKVPALIERAKQELAKGNVPVFSLVNTNEAGATREIAKALERGEQLDMDDVNFGPKQILLDFLTKEGEKSYNGQKNAYKDYQFPTMKPVKGDGGEVLGFERDQIADAIRRRLVSEVEKLPDDFGNPINMIIDAFGKDNVANLTGLNRGGMAADYRAFQDGDKKVLVFSGVANTGYTFSSDRKYKNQARRVAFPLQLGYRADELEQTLGRVHRNNQANAPIYVASTTDLPGERRFYSSVERRRGQMKALTTGDRSATGNGITSEGDNFETKYAQQAVDAIISRLHAMGKLDAIAREMNFIKRTQRRDGSVVEVNGMLKKDKSGAILPNVPAKRFLNRLLMLDPKKQDGMFTAFKSYLDQIVQWAKEDGEYDIGLQDIGSTRNDPVRSVKLADDMEVQHVNSWFKTDKQTFDDFAKAHAAEFVTYVRNKRTGETFAVRADGKMGKKQEPAAMRYAVDGTKRRMKASILDTDKPNAAYERLDAARAKELWDAEYGVIPDERADDGFYATGDLLRHWADVLGSKPPRTFRVKAGDAPEYIGAKIDADEIPAIFGRFGKAEAARDMVIDGKVREVLNNRTVDLVNGWTLKQVPRDGAKAVMVRGVEPVQLDAVAKELGGEVSKKRIFMKPDAAKLRKIIEDHPANLYRDDEKIGDTGNLRFFNVGEEGAGRLGIGKKDEALRFEGAGADREEIWRKTGWWRGRDGKWRVEIPDAKLPTWKIEWLENDSRVNPGNDYPVSVLASAKELFAAYPELKDVRISVRRLPTGTYAESDIQGRRIVLNDLLLRGRPHSVESTLNHELQHFIQGIEGFAKGGNAFKMGHEEYLRQAGEVESRNIQKRLAMTPEERAATPPWATEDVPESEQHVRFFDTREEADRDRDAAYRDWLKRYGMDDTEKHRAEWERKHPATKVAERRISPAEDAAYMDAVKHGDTETAQRMVREAAERSDIPFDKDRKTGKLLEINTVTEKKPIISAEQWKHYKNASSSFVKGVELTNYGNQADLMQMLGNQEKVKVYSGASDLGRFGRLPSGFYRITAGPREGEIIGLVEDNWFNDQRKELRKLRKEWEGLDRELYYTRGTDNKTEPEILSVLVSRNWLDGFAEDGVSVSTGRGYSLAYKYTYLVMGDVVGKGSDGEPVLQNAKALTLPSAKTKPYVERDVNRQEARAVPSSVIDYQDWNYESAFADRSILVPIGRMTDSEPALETVFVDSRHRILKSADAVTRDDSGNVIPLSQRFNPQSNDIRFFDKGEEADRDRDAAYRDWLKRYGMDDTEKHRAEWEQKHPATKVAERRISPAEDAAYMDAVKRGDMETAHKMVREAAKKSIPGVLLDEEGYPKVVYHGTNKQFTVFDESKQGYDPGFFFAENRIRPKDGWTKEYAEYYGGNVMSVFLSNPDVLPRGEYRVKDATQIKSADAVTRDDAGNVIPLSQRFNLENSDIRYFNREEELSPREEIEREKRGIGGIYTGTAADYANRVPVLDKDGNQTGWRIENGPSLKKVGTGEGSQVYGWGLYGSTVRGVAEGYAKDAREYNAEKNGKRIDLIFPKNMLEAETAKRLMENGGDVRKTIEKLKLKGIGSAIIKELEEHGAEYSVAPKHEHLYEQTFFTDRAPGDESHLLKWYEDLPKEQVDWIAQEFAKEGFFVASFSKLKGWAILDRTSGKKMSLWDKRESGEAYEAIAKFLGSPQAASEFLARAGIDGVKYPVDSYGGKGVKDGDKAGWNYVSFRDDNIRVDHKWTDGEMRYFNIDEEAARRVHAKDYDEALRMEGAGAGRREIWEKTGWWRGKDGKMRYEIKGISASDTQSMLDAVFTSGKFRDMDKANVYTFTLGDLERELKAKGERLPDSVKTLLTAYPKLAKEKIEIDRMAEQPKDGTLGYATSGRDGKIHLYERGTTAETLNHELQHRIQEMSGMAGGTNTDGKSFDRYTHEHGEWEARQAATRAEMSADERGATAPWETSDRHGVAEDATQIDDTNRARIRPDGEPPEPEPAAPAMERNTTLGDKYRTNATDRYDPIKQMVIESGKRDKKAIYNGGDPYDAMRQLHGHNEAARQRYEKIWKKPFEDMLRKSGVGLDDVGMYMIATNAKDRNRKVLNRSGALDGAGLSDADADKVLADLRGFLGAEKMRKIEEMADFLWKMQKEGMERRVASGRVSREMADQWEREEPHHVPMRDDLSDEDGEYNRSTRQWRKNDFAEAKGRYTLPDNPVEFMFKEYQDAMYGSNMNEARRALADFVRGTPGIGKVKRGIRRGKAWSFTHKQIEDFPDPNYREQTVKGGPGRPNLVAFKEGGNLYMIELNGKQGERVAEAVIGRGVVNMWKPVAAFTRGYASTATELSPTFLGRNFVSDMVEASLNTMADKGLIKGGASAVKNVINALRMTRTIRKYITTGRFEGEFADVMRRYVESGASIGGMGNEGYTELKNDLGKVASGKRGVADVLKFVGRGISNLNKQAELATRLAVFKDYIDGGASDGEAAMRSREYSTDFNKYGNQRWMNSAWMFSGSVLGGAVRQTASLVQGKAGKQLMAGLFTYGLLEGMLEHFYNADDDEKGKKSGTPSGATMTEYNRANSLYFRMGDKFIRVPFHAGPFSVLKYAGNLAARAALGDISGAEAAKHIGKEALDSGMHFTGTGDFNSDTPMQSVLPTLLVPFYQLKGNEDYAGRPIQRQMYSETKPYSENGRKQTGDIWKSMARGMNELTGGNEKRRGWFDFSPEKYKFVVDSALKNLGRDITTVSDFVTDLREGREIDNTHILFGRDYVRDVPDNTSNFYEAERRYKADRADGTIKQGSRRDEAVKKLLKEIETLRHWEDGEEKVGSRWVKKRTPSDAVKEKHKKLRLRLQQRVINVMGGKSD